MRVLQGADQLQPQGRRVGVAIGVFDGVHLGHQQVIREALASARRHGGLSLVLTFDRHPNAVVAPHRVPPAVYTLSQKLRALASLGVDATWVVRFDEAFARRTGEEFVRSLARDLGSLETVCVGGDFTFGHKRSGNVSLLASLGKELGFSVPALSSVALDGEVISSTRIRECIRAGDLATASRLLGRPYAVSGIVKPGEQLGRKLGFPTANLEVSGLVLPPGGVYAARVLVDGRPHPAVVNLGERPTLNLPSPTLQFEVHLLDYDADLYGCELEVGLAGRLREEMKFPSLDLLKEQIARDAQAARVTLGC